MSDERSRELDQRLEEARRRLAENKEAAKRRAEMEYSPIYREIKRPGRRFSSAEENREERLRIIAERERSISEYMERENEENSRRAEARARLVETLSASEGESYAPVGSDKDDRGGDAPYTDDAFIYAPISKDTVKGPVSSELPSFRDENEIRERENVAYSRGVADGSAIRTGNVISDSAEYIPIGKSGSYVLPENERHYTGAEQPLYANEDGSSNPGSYGDGYKEGLLAGKRASSSVSYDEGLYDGAGLANIKSSMPADTKAKATAGYGERTSDAYAVYAYEKYMASKRADKDRSAEAEMLSAKGDDAPSDVKDRATLGSYESDAEMKRITSTGADQYFSSSEFDKYNLCARLGELEAKRIEGEREIAAAEKRLDRLPSHHVDRADLYSRIAVKRRDLVINGMEALTLAVHYRNKSETSKHKKILLTLIEQHNAHVERVGAENGTVISAVSESVVTDILAGREPVRVLRLKATEKDLPAESVAKSSSLEKKRDLYMAASGENNGRTEKNAKSTSTVGKLDPGIKRSKERELLLVRLRLENAISKLSSGLYAVRYSYSGTRGERKRETMAIDREIGRTKRLIKTAVRFEKKDNERYYYLKENPIGSLKLRKRADKSKLESIRSRLDVLLLEREQLTEDLLSLYAEEGGTKLHSTGSDRKELKAMKRSYSKQKRLAARLEKLHAPEDVKRKIYELMDKRTELASLIESSEYKLKKNKPGKKEKRTLSSAIKNAERDIRDIDRSIASYMKRAKKHHSDFHSELFIGLGVLVLMAVTVGGVLLWYYFGNGAGV